MFIPIFEIITDYKSVIPNALTHVIAHDRPYERVKVGSDSDHWLIFDPDENLIPITNDGCVFLGKDFTVYRQSKGTTLPSRIHSSIHRYEDRRMRPLNNMEVSNFHNQSYVSEANNHRIQLDKETITSTIYRRILKDWKIEAEQKVTFELKHADGTRTKLQNYGRDSGDIPKVNIFLIPNRHWDIFTKTYPDAYVRKWVGGQEMLVNMNGVINILRFYSENNPRKLMEWGSTNVIAKMSDPEAIARDVRVMMSESAHWLELKYVAYNVTKEIVSEVRTLLDCVHFEDIEGSWVVVPFVEWGIKLNQPNRAT